MNPTTTWVGERLLRAVWLGEITCDNPTGSLGEELEIRIEGRRFSDSESRMFVEHVQSGHINLSAESVQLSSDGFELLRYWARFAPIGGAA